MRFVVKRLLLGLVLIVSACVALLLSDLGRRTAVARSVPHVALLQHASTMLLDEGARGTIDGLAKNGFVDGKTIVIDRFNAQGDISVGNSIAKENTTNRPSSPCVAAFCSPANIYARRPSSERTV